MGNTGSQGPRGLPGNRGPPGEKGDNCVEQKGEKGDTGERGERGSQGPAAEPNVLDPSLVIRSTLENQGFECRAMGGTKEHVVCKMCDEWPPARWEWSHAPVSTEQVCTRAIDLWTESGSSLDPVRWWVMEDDTFVCSGAKSALDQVAQGLYTGFSSSSWPTGDLAQERAVRTSLDGLDCRDSPDGTFALCKESSKWSAENRWTASVNDNLSCVKLDDGEFECSNGRCTRLQQGQGAVLKGPVGGQTTSIVLQPGEYKHFWDMKLQGMAANENMDRWAEEIQLAPGCSADLFTSGNFEGERTRLNQGSHTISNASSAKVWCVEADAPLRPGEGARLKSSRSSLTLPAGEYIKLAHITSNEVEDGMNNKVNEIHVAKGCTVEVYSAIEFNSTMGTLKGDATHIGGEEYGTDAFKSDDISSLRVKCGIIPGSDRKTQPGPNGATEKLTQHTLDCGSNGLNRFQLTSSTDDSVSYNYRCLYGADSPANIQKSTPRESRGDGSVIFLDRHDVDCGQNPIAKFNLTRPEDDKLSYNYTCNSKAAAGQCRDVTTEWKDENGVWKVIHLEQHDVVCQDDEVITRFKMQRNVEEKSRYEYKCCKVAN